jgi:site-specific DNA-methyltransferase (adenine-specific)
MIYKPQTSEAKQWSGWKTALKPAHEPIVMARKPFRGSTIDNVLAHGVGALNIDATRIGLEEGAINPNTAVEYTDYSFGNAGEGNKQNNLPSKFNPNEKGRFPSNVLGEIPDYQKYFYCPKVSRRERHCGFEQEPITTEQMVAEMGGKITGNRIWTPDLGEFYIHGLKHEYEEWCKKNNKLQLGDSAPQGERRCSKDSYERWQQSIEYRKGGKPDPLAHIPADSTGKRYYCEIEQRKAVGNNHPTVKPVALMRWLINLVTPKNSKVLDPFTGSGSTGMAAVELGHEFVGCELDPNYCEIAKKRIEGWNKPDSKDSTFADIFEEK